jgi:hypothetical protein
VISKALADDSHPLTTTGVISEALGHKGEKITQTYLKNFGSDVIDEANCFYAEQSSN